MRTPNKEKIALIRRQQQKESVGGILLPDEFTIGTDSKTSGYRLAELISGPDYIPRGAKVILAEVNSQEIGFGIHRAPLQFILAYLDDFGKCIPLQDLVLIKLDPKAEKISSSSLLFIPDCSRPPSTTGTVIAIGEDVKDPDIRIGSKALIALFSGLEIYLEDIGECALVRYNPLKNHTDELLGVFIDA